MADWGLAGMVTLGRGGNGGRVRCEFTSSLQSQEVMTLSQCHPVTMSSCHIVTLFSCYSVQQSSYYGLAGMLPKKYTQAIQAGEGGRGMHVCSLTTVLC